MRNNDGSLFTICNLFYYYRVKAFLEIFIPYG